MRACEKTYCASRLLRCAVLAPRRTAVYCLVAALRAPCTRAARYGFFHKP